MDLYALYVQRERFAMFSGASIDGSFANSIDLEGFQGSEGQFQAALQTFYLLDNFWESCVRLEFIRAFFVHLSKSLVLIGFSKVKAEPFFNTKTDIYFYQSKTNSNINSTSITKIRHNDSEFKLDQELKADNLEADNLLKRPAGCRYMF